MGLRTLIAWEWPEKDFNASKASWYLFDSVTGRVTGRPFASEADLEAFLDYLTDAELVMEPLVPLDPRDFSDHEWDAHLVVFTAWNKGPMCTRCGTETNVGLAKHPGHKAPQLVCSLHAPTNDGSSRPYDDTESFDAPVININRDGEAT